uniref:SET domain-containing protein n=1 Tax=Pyrodinium bahamense TaxID=73915 RepID=A0A7S0FAC2_9DINO
MAQGTASGSKHPRPGFLGDTRAEPVAKMGSRSCHECHEPSVGHAEPEVESAAAYQGLDRGVELRTLGLKGWGAVATRGIEAGECILREQALVTVTAAERLQLPGDDEEAEAELWDLKAQALDAASAAQFWRMHDFGGEGEKSAYGIALTNAMHLTERKLGYAAPGGTSGKMPSVGVLACLCRFNHGCTPNVYASWRDFEGHMVVHALRDIAAGEELVQAYSSDVAFLPWSVRQQYLTKWRMQCQCTACSQSWSERAASDKCRMLMLVKSCVLGLRSLPTNQEVQHLADEVQRGKELIDQDNLRGVQLVLELVLLVDMELRGNPHLKEGIYFRGYELALQGGRPDFAVDMLCSAYQQCCLAEGSDSPRAGGYRDMFTAHDSMPPAF